MNGFTAHHGFDRANENAYRKGKHILDLQTHV
jgi:hypothetical protein